MLSIIIPTYNEEELLPRLLRSLERQTFRDYELIVADAHSTDRTRAVAVEGGCRVVDGGLPAVGRNAGAKAAKGDIFLFLDADVELADQHFLAGFIQAFEDRGLDVASCLLRSAHNSAVESALYRAYNTYINVMEQVFPHAHGPCILARRATHEALHGFDESVLLAEDHNYAQRAHALGAKVGVLSGFSIPVSDRRFVRDGYVSTACKYVLCELHMMAIGPVRSDIFKYRFGYPKKRVRSRLRKA